jgi:hypothetical protein
MEGLAMAAERAAGTPVIGLACNFCRLSHTACEAYALPLSALITQR